MKHLTDIQNMLLAILVRDFKYTYQPTYGHTPLRHQFAWQMAVEGMSEVDLKCEIAEMLYSTWRERDK